jgi:hypothetical protein
MRLREHLERCRRTDGPTLFPCEAVLWFAKTMADFEINDLSALPPLLCYNS